MHSRVRTAIVLLTLTGVIGIWLALAPFLTGYQLSGDPWITATIHHVTTGTILAVISFTAVLTIIGGALRSLDDMVDTTDATTDPNHPLSQERDLHEEGYAWNRG